MSQQEKFDYLCRIGREFESCIINAMPVNDVKRLRMFGTTCGRAEAIKQIEEEIHRYNEQIRNCAEERHCSPASRPLLRMAATTVDRMLVSFKLKWRNLESSFRAERETVSTTFQESDEVRHERSKTYSIKFSEKTGKYCWKSFSYYYAISINFFSLSLRLIAEWRWRTSGASSAKLSLL